MATSNVIPVSPVEAAMAAHYAALDAAQAPLIDAALANTSEAAYRAAVGFEAATQLERLALTWLRKAMRETLDGTDADRWFVMVPNALREATPVEAELLNFADCAIESGLRCAVH